MRSRYGTSIDSILHLTDFSHGSDVAYAHALRMAVALRSGLDILHVRRHGEESDWDRYPAVRETLQQWGYLPASARRQDVAGLGVRIAKAVSEAREPVSGVLQHLQRHEADLIVMATHRREGLDRWLHGGIAESLSARVDAATLLIPYGVDGFVNRSSGKVSLRRVLIPMDSAPSPESALSSVSELIGSLTEDGQQVEVRLLHVGDESGMPAPRLPDSDCCVWSWENRRGNVVDTILDDAAQQQVDLVAMTTKGHDGFLDILRGSTTERVLQRAGCPVLSVPAE